jgi:hypothetical protein
MRTDPDRMRHGEAGAASARRDLQEPSSPVIARDAFVPEPATSEPWPLAVGSGVYSQPGCPVLAGFGRAASG